MTEIGKRSDKAYLGSHSGRIWRELCREGREGEERKRERERSGNGSYPNRSCDSGSKEQQHKFLLQKETRRQESGPRSSGVSRKAKAPKGQSTATAGLMIRPSLKQQTGGAAAAEVRVGSRIQGGRGSWNFAGRRN